MTIKPSPESEMEEIPPEGRKLINEILRILRQHDAKFALSALTVVVAEVINELYQDPLTFFTDEYCVAVKHSFNDLTRANALRSREWDPESKCTGLFFAVELTGEVGEACNIVKKLEREKLGLPGSRANLHDLGNELADIVIVCDLLATAYGITLSDKIVSKFNNTSRIRGFTTKL
jgi:NTP pyrophosphatase (non-canonical NTP hydrolase)